MPNTNNKQDLVFSKQVAYLFGQMYAVLITNIISALILTIIYWHIIGDKILSIWLASLITLQAYLWLVTEVYDRRHPSPRRAKFWLGLFLIAFIPSILLWTWVSFYMLAFDTFFYKMFMLFILMAIVTSGVVSLSSVRSVYHILLLALMIPVILQFVYMGYKGHHTTELDIGILLCIYCIIIRDAANRNHAILYDAIVMRYKLQDMANVDSLTQLGNRRKFDAYFKRQWQRGTRNFSPLALIIIDVDLFKPYNDHYGHQAGDQCLRRVALALESGLKRPVDLVARYGGEEFAVVLPDTHAKGAMQVAENLRRRVKRLRLLHEYSDIGPNVTISLGVAAKVPRPTMDPKVLIEAADRALYNAKAQGRNRACLSEKYYD